MPKLGPVCGQGALSGKTLSRFAGNRPVFQMLIQKDALKNRAWGLYRALFWESDGNILMYPLEGYISVSMLSLRSESWGLNLQLSQHVKMSSLIFNRMTLGRRATGKTLGSHATHSGLCRKREVLTYKAASSCNTWGGLAVPHHVEPEEVTMVSIGGLLQVVKGRPFLSY